jgi:3-methylcrotonyl-CoA carboxylase alpha subunit
VSGQAAHISCFLRYNQRMFTKILIANRGEIAVRIIRACRALGIGAVVVYSEADQGALHVRMADEAYLIGPAPAPQSYLRSEALLEAALRSGAQAIHPGYGFLSERAHFAQAVRDAGLVFIGPPAEAIALMGDKVAAKHLAIQAGIPTIPGYLGDSQSTAHLQEEAEQIGFPLLIKASAGGGGRGMRSVHSAEEFVPALESAQREAEAAFGSQTVFLERLVLQPRHIEIQILADSHGACVHLFERECSIQRRHQKLVEESPSPALSASQRATMGAAAVQLATAARYVNAGTIEFLFDQSGDFFFLEMNTRLQVEHPVTELVTGLDLVQLQIAIAAGQPLPFTQADISQAGHAIEVRVCAEDPVTFLPASGDLALFTPPEGPGLRNDSGVETGDVVTVYYDPMIAKLIASGPDRQTAIARLRAALDDYAILGVITNIPLLERIVAHPAFASGDTTTDFLERHAVAAPLPAELPFEVLAAAALLDERRPRAPAAPWQSGPWRIGGSVRWYRAAGQDWRVTLERLPEGVSITSGTRSEHFKIADQTAASLSLTLDTRQHQYAYVQVGRDLLIHWQGQSYQLGPVQALSADTYTSGQSGKGAASLEAPMPGTIIRVFVTEGDQVQAHQPLVVLEAMKMEYIVAAPHAGIVRHIAVHPGVQVVRGAILIDIAGNEGDTIGS